MANGPCAAYFDANLSPTRVGTLFFSDVSLSPNSTYALFYI